jgi:hypothetical protein
MRARKGYIPVDSMFPHMGMNTTVPSTLLDPSFSPLCQDVTVQDGLVRKRAGYRLLGNLSNVVSVQTTGDIYYPMSVWWQGPDNMDNWVPGRGINVFIWNTAVYFSPGDWERAHQKIESLRQAGHNVWVIRMPAYLLVPDTLDINFDLKWRSHVAAWALVDELEDKVPGGGGGNVLFAPSVIANYIKAQVDAYHNWMPGIPIWCNFNGTHINGTTLSTYVGWVNQGIDIVGSDSYPCCNQQTFTSTGAKLYPNVVNEMVNGPVSLKGALGSSKKVWCFLECTNQGINVAGTPGWAPGYTFDGSRSPTTSEINTAISQLNTAGVDGIMWFPQQGNGTVMDGTTAGLVSTMLANSNSQQALVTNATLVLPTSDTVMDIIDFTDSLDNHHLVAVTTKRRYEYNPNTTVWTDITGSTAWTGDETDAVSWVVAQGTDVAGNKVLIITNGKDKPQLWNGITSTFASVSWNYPGFATCGCLATMNGVVIMADITNTVSGTQRNAQNVAWSAFGKVNEWLDATQGAGEETIYDTTGAIVSLEELSGMMAVYGEDSIHLMSYVAGDLIFTFSKILEGTRLLSGRSIANLGTFHVFPSQENFLLFDGTAKMPSVADAVHQTYRTEVNAGLKYKAFSTFDRVHRRVYFTIPTDVNTSKVYLLDYDVNNIAQWKWTVVNYTNRPTAFGFFEAASTRTWGDSSLQFLTWGSDAQRWADATQNKGFPLLVMGSTNGQVFLLDDKTFSDNGAAINMVWQSKDFTVPQEYISEKARWIEIEFEATGGPVDVNYYVDQSDKPTSVVRLFQGDVVTSSQGTLAFKRYKLPIDVVATSLRVEFSTTWLGDFQLKWVRPWLRPAGAR